VTVRDLRTSQRFGPPFLFPAQLLLFPLSPAEKLNKCYTQKPSPGFAPEPIAEALTDPEVPGTGDAAARGFAYCRDCHEKVDCTHALAP
jgi:hypothetical protein